MAVLCAGGTALTSARLAKEQNRTDITGTCARLAQLAALAVTTRAAVAVRLEGRRRRVALWNQTDVMPSMEHMCADFEDPVALGQAARQAVIKPLSNVPVSQI